MGARWSDSVRRPGDVYGRAEAGQVTRREMHGTASAAGDLDRRSGSRTPGRATGGVGPAADAPNTSTLSGPARSEEDGWGIVVGMTVALLALVVFIWLVTAGCSPADSVFCAEDWCMTDQATETATVPVDPSVSQTSTAARSIAAALPAVLPPTRVAVDPPSWARCPQWWRLASRVGWPVDQLGSLDYVMWRESRCTPGAVSPAGDHGLTQVNARHLTTAGYAQLCSRTSGRICTTVDLHRPRKNLRAAFVLYGVADDWFGCGWQPWRTAGWSPC